MKSIVQVLARIYDGELVETYCDDTIQVAADLNWCPSELDGWRDVVDWSEIGDRGLYAITFLIDVVYTKDYYGEIDADIYYDVYSAEKFPNFGQLRYWYENCKELQ